MDKKGNYLDKRPVRSQHVNWSKEDSGMVVLSIENKGFFNRLAQLLFKKPKISYIHLDEIGSFVWPLIDGEKTIGDMAEDVKLHFSEKADPVYERLARYFQILASYNFINWNE